MSTQEDQNINPLVRRYRIPRGRDAGKWCVEISARNLKPSDARDVHLSIRLGNEVVMDEVTGHAIEVLNSRTIIDPTKDAFVNDGSLQAEDRWFYEGFGVVVEEELCTDLVTGEVTRVEQLARRWPDDKRSLDLFKFV